MPSWPLQRGYRAPTLDFGEGHSLRWGTRTFLMAIINATSDSFSGDGLGGEIGHARSLAAKFHEADADLIDVGGESTRPGADTTTPATQLARVLPVIDAIRDVTDTPISIDTSSAEVAAAALERGASLVNDVTGLRGDPELAAVVAEHGVPVVAMHNQRDRRHHDVIGDIRSGFDESLEICADAGIDFGKVVLDPGFGFGWAVEQNLEMLRRLPELWELEIPLLVGTSRKSSIGAVLDADVRRRRFGTAATVAQAICAGVDIVRVHDVVEMSEVARMTDAIVR